MLSFSWLLLLFTLGAYLIGSISTAIIVSKLMGLPDPRKQGSQNPGATNVLRLGGKKAAAITLLGDALKGFVPVVLATLYLQPDNEIAMVGMAAFLGHLFPVFFGFKGGKGVATAFGVLLGLSWIVGICVLATWLAVAMLLKISSLAALVSACMAPFYIWWWEDKPSWIALGILLSIFLIARHHSNIRNLLNGKEDKIQKR